MLNNSIDYLNSMLDGILERISELEKQCKIGIERFKLIDKSLKLQTDTVEPLPEIPLADKYQQLLKFVMELRIIPIPINTPIPTAENGIDVGWLKARIELMFKINDILKKIGESKGKTRI